MTNNQEVEYIGELSDKQYNNLKSKFGQPIKTKRRISFMYFKNGIPFEFSQAEDDGTDLRLRVTNGEPELILKQGSFTASHNRKETSVHFKLSEIQTYIDLLSGLGWKIVVAYGAETSVYKYNKIEFSLIKIKNYGYNFEAEILTSEDKVTEAKQKIEAELSKLELKPFDEQGLNKQCNAINNKKELQFDFSKQQFKDIEVRFKEFL
ncbi:MAG TPA: hypothetical protein VFE88_01585 [Candidatus Nanoarchaeia archaeon]|nr:hypothetical protein [Candidatus Nanoarchaeia archaeon]